MNLSAVLDELVEERGLDRQTLSTVVCEGMRVAYEKRYPHLELRVDFDSKTDTLSVFVKKFVVSSVEDDQMEISLRKARNIDPTAEVDAELWLPFDGGIGRIEILKAKQVIASEIRKIEASAVYNEFKDKEGTIVHGVIHKCERGGMVIKLQDNLAFLPKSLTSPEDRCNVGITVRALLKEVLQEPRSDNQLILDRASEQFLYKLFELEVPEVFEKLVEIKGIVRTAGYKSKIAVVSNDPNIDPVGTCVGVGGARIKPILKELGGEKIDVIPWTEMKELFVKNALKPAEINRVELVDEENAQVWLDEDQRSLAIGRKGQNISLASRLTGVKIHLVQNETGAMEQEDEPQEPADDVEE